MKPFPESTIHNTGRSLFHPHVIEIIDHENKRALHRCEQCGDERIATWLDDPLELNRVATAYSFLDHHRHDEWPDIIE